VLHEFRRRRHVAIVLPEPLARDTAMTDGLVRELTAELRHSAQTRHVASDPDAGTLLAALGRALVFDDYPPATIVDLLYHPDCAGGIAILVATDQPDKHQQELPDLLRRLEIESRSAPSDDRLTLVVIGSRRHLPHFAGGENSDVSVAAVWWWNRVNRWDVAAHAAEIDETAFSSRVLADVRTETIVAVARWDLDLAEHLAQSWDSDPATLVDCLTPTANGDRPHHSRAGSRTWPGEALIDDWDNLRVDGWHDAHSVTAHAAAAAPERLARLVWAAQSRILLPWIEERRMVLQERVIAVLGQRRFREAIRNLFASEPLDNTEIVEVGPLRMLIDVRIGGSNPKLRSAARRLHEARNRLAHLDPLGHAELRELVSACDSLTGLGLRTCWNDSCGPRPAID
jgi:hypothetical protein